jgi:large subunit ribosomal protein L31e
MAEEKENKTDKKEEQKEKTIESKSAVENIKKTDSTNKKKPSKKDSKNVDSSGKVELEREYVVPLKKGVLNVPRYKRAKKAIKILKEFVVRHMAIRDRDLNKVKVDINLNNEIWFKGIKNPLGKIKIRAKKIDGLVFVELADIPEYVGFKIAREKKKSEAAEKAKVKSPKKVEAEEKTEEEKTEEKEDIKAAAEKAEKTKKDAAKTAKHTSKGAHAQKSMPVRKVLK